MKQVFIGAEFLTNKDNPQVVLHKFSRRGPAVKWLQAFETRKVGEDLLVRLVFTMPPGYRERKDVVKTFHVGNRTWTDARFFCSMEFAINTTGEKRIIDVMQEFLQKEVSQF